MKLVLFKRWFRLVELDGGTVYVWSLMFVEIE
jgi:hypothetical protein